MGRQLAGEGGSVEKTGKIRNEVEVKSQGSRVSKTIQQKGTLRRGDAHKGGNGKSKNRTTKVAGKIETGRQWGGKKNKKVRQGR